ncbi:S1 family peptidase [Hyalangium versicolor]|uniref:S1 family peptidase n=1 Tax=Hyalangium versicolor TaxID=2861190 RepID=UPI001CCB52F1|nr:trypsin-like serine protease [Hyalangium versicolor]
MRRFLCMATLVMSVAAHASPASADLVGSGIIGGTFTEGDSGVVALRTGEEVFCSGVLMAPDVVMTAAHCVAVTRNLSVLVGSGPAGEVIPVTEVHLHPTYVPATLENDIALVRLERAVADAPRWSVISLEDSWEGKPLRIIGFGKISREDEGTPMKHTGSAVLAGLQDTRLSVAAGPSIPCFRDSGGAILLSIEGEEFLAGIITTGSVDCTPTAMAYGTRADVFLEGFITPYLEATASEGGCAAHGGGQGAPGGPVTLVLIGLFVLARQSRPVLAATPRPGAP